MKISTRWTRALTALGASAALTGCAHAAQAASTGHVRTSSLTVLAEPQAGVAPFLKMINGARKSIELTMYELFDHRVEQALVAAHRRGVAVRVLLNGGYYSQHEDTNAQAFRYLHSHGVQVRYTPTYFALTHQKTLSVDGRESAVMSLNFDGLYSTTRDFAVLDTQRADVAAIVQAFDADWAGRRITASTGTGDLVWSPGAAPTVLRMIDSARRSIELEDEEMDYPPATAALCDAARRGVAVHVVMTYASEWRSAFATLGRCGVRVHLYHGQRYYIHAKLLIVDGRQALVSSQNLSEGSLTYNRELGVVITNQSPLVQLAHDFGCDYAKPICPPGGASSPRETPYARIENLTAVDAATPSPSRTRHHSPAPQVGLERPAAAARVSSSPVSREPARPLPERKSRGSLRAWAKSLVPPSA